MPVVLGIVLANFVYQLFLIDPNWAVAFERSFFQCTAIACYVLYLKSNGERNSST